VLATAAYLILAGSIFHRVERHVLEEGTLDQY